MNALKAIGRFTKRAGLRLLTVLKWFVLSTLIWIVIILALAIIDEIRGQEHVSGAHTTDHFTFVYTDIPTEDVEHLGSSLERDYERITTELGVSDMPHIIVYLYPEGSQEFYDQHSASGSQDFDVGGFVRSNAIDTIHLRWLEKPEDSLASKFTAPTVAGSYGTHEFTHLVMHNLLYEKAFANGAVRSRAQWQRVCTSWRDPYCSPPLWLDESVAQYEAGIWGGEQLLTEYESRAETLEPAALSHKDLYIYGRLVGEYIVDRWGAEGLRSMIVENADPQAALGIPMEEFNRGFRVYAAKRMEGLLRQYRATGQILTP